MKRLITICWLLASCSTSDQVLKPYHYTVESFGGMSFTGYKIQCYTIHDIWWVRKDRYTRREVLIGNKPTQLDIMKACIDPSLNLEETYRSMIGL